VPYENAFLLRSSPVIFAFDGLGVLVSWVSRILFRLEGPREAATVVLRARFPSSVSGYDDPLKPLTRLKDQRGPGHIAFLLGVLPQCIKLFASRGIPWIQAFGAMYLASWALFEWLIFLADPSREAHPDPTPWPQFSKWPVEKCWGLAGVISYSLLWGFSVCNH
jgi:hypothetical protein